MAPRFPLPTIAALALAVAVAAWRLRDHGGDDRRSRAGAFWAGVGVLTLIAAAMFSEAWTRGWVLSQAQALFAFYPWAAAPPEGLAPRNPLLGDAAFQGAPWLYVTCHALRSGHLPLWNADNFAGHPFLASFLPGALSPFTAVACLAPFPWATVVIAALRVVVAGSGTFCWLRALGTSSRAALVGAVAGALNPFLLVWLEDASGGAAAVAPWCLWAVTRAVQQPGRQTCAAVAVTLALLLLAGQPETAFKVGLLALLIGMIGVAGAPPQTSRRRMLATLGIGAVAGVLLASAQILPFAEYARESRVLADRETRDVNTSFTPRRTIVTAFVPDFFGHPTGTTVPVANRYGAVTNYMEQVLYPGAAVWILAAVGLAARPRRAWPLALGGTMAALFKFGAPGALMLASTLPLLRVTPLGRFGLVTIVVLIVLAGLGVDALVDDRETWPSSTARRRMRMGWVAVGSAAVVVIGIAGALALERSMLLAVGLWPATLRHAAIASALVSATAALVVARTRGRIAAAWFATAIVALLVVDLVPFARAFRPLAPASQVYAPTSELEHVQRDPDVFRVAGWGSALPANANAVYGVAQYRGYDSMNLVRYGRLLDAAVGPERLLFHDRPFADSAIFDLLNVKYVFTTPEVVPPAPHFEPVGSHGRLYRNRRVLPRAFLVDGFVVVPEAHALQIVANHELDLSRHAVLEAPLPAAARPDARAADAPPDDAVIVAYSSHAIEIRTRSTGRRLLVTSDADHPGWIATVDGTPADIHRANYAFRAVAVPAGTHVVRFEYAPRAFRLGAVLSLVTLAALIGVCWWPARQGRDRVAAS